MSTLRIPAPTSSAESAASRYRRRAEDQPQLPAIDLLPGEFRPRSVTPGVRAISLGSSGHEHTVDPERLTITCLLCQQAEAAEAAQIDLHRITLEVSAALYLDLKAAAGGRPVEIYAAELLGQPAKR
ncbi:MAG: hypothetical protein ACYDC5_10625 [Candidatus Dormibacteria bacterium]